MPSKFQSFRVQMPPFLSLRTTMDTEPAVTAYSQRRSQLLKRDPVREAPMYA